MNEKFRLLKKYKKDSNAGNISHIKEKIQTKE